MSATQDRLDQTTRKRKQDSDSKEQEASTKDQETKKKSKNKETVKDLEAFARSFMNDISELEGMLESMGHDIQMAKYVPMHNVKFVLDDMEKRVEELEAAIKDIKDQLSAETARKTTCCLLLEHIEDTQRLLDDTDSEGSSGRDTEDDLSWV